MICLAHDGVRVELVSGCRIFVSLARFLRLVGSRMCTAPVFCRCVVFIDIFYLVVSPFAKGVAARAFSAHREEAGLRQDVWICAHLTVFSHGTMRNNFLKTTNHRPTSSRVGTKALGLERRFRTLYAPSFLLGRKNQPEIPKSVTCARRRRSRSRARSSARCSAVERTSPSGSLSSP